MTFSAFLSRFKPHALAALAAAAPLAFANNASAASPTTAAAPAPESPYLFGDWNGERTRLEDKGVKLSFGNTLDLYGNVAGGNEEEFIYFDRQRISATLDLEKLLNWTDTQLYISTVAQYGRNNGKRDIGLYTNPSGIEGQRTTRLAEIWVSKKFFDKKLELKAGKIDGVGEFGAQEYGSTFMNDELGYLPNALFASGMPFDPAGKPGVVATVYPFSGDYSGIYAKAGVFAGNDNNAYAHDRDGLNFNMHGPTIVGAEVGYRRDGALPGLYKLGVHYNSGSFTNLVNPAQVYGDNTLVYFNASQTLFYVDDARTRHVDAGFTVASGSGDRNANELQFTALVRMIGPFESRPQDEIGLGFIASNFSDEASQANVLAGGNSLDSEKTIELTYKVRVRPGLTVQPDLQLVLDPQGDSSRGNVLIVGLRTSIDF